MAPVASRRLPHCLQFLRTLARVRIGSSAWVTSVSVGSPISPLHFMKWIPSWSIVYIQTPPGVISVAVVFVVIRILGGIRASFHNQKDYGLLKYRCQGAVRLRERDCDGCADARRRPDAAWSGRAVGRSGDSAGFAGAEGSPMCCQQGETPTKFDCSLVSRWGGVPRFRGTIPFLWQISVSLDLD